ncbi:MAG: hypothetical protein GY737_28775, partial [Desulfobacteraceae bacterium]|nr:hypothetical protein [Desulfobacteraceae bacterium]
YENNSHDNKEGENNVEEQLPTPQVRETEEERVEQGVSEEKGPIQRGKVPEFLSCSLPTEQSFFTSRPTQSSPQKDIKVSKANPPAAYLWNESRKLRSTGEKVHLSLEFNKIKNPLKVLTSPFKKKKQ